LVASPIEHLQAVNDAYADKYDVTMKREVKKETGGECEDALIYLLGRKLEKCPETTAAEIKACTKGWGCDENGLMNLLSLGFLSSRHFLMLLEKRMRMSMRKLLRIELRVNLEVI